MQQLLSAAGRVLLAVLIYDIIRRSTDVVLATQRHCLLPADSSLPTESGTKRKMNGTVGAAQRPQDWTTEKMPTNLGLRDHCVACVCLVMGKY